MLKILSMAPTILPLTVLLLSYIIGSIPSGWLAGHWLKGVDLRKLGSGSTGATNVLRQVGPAAALVVFIVDVGKGTAAVLLAQSIQLQEDWHVLAGLAALVGHIWPIWLGWKGGKAVATGFGMFLGLCWPAGLACFGIFLAVVSLSKIVSLASVIAALSLPILVILSSREIVRPAYLAISLIATALVLWRHRANIRRLMAGTEPRLGQNS